MIHSCIKHHSFILDLQNLEQRKGKGEPKQKKMIQH